jgi:hypothetical protein
MYHYILLFIKRKEKTRNESKLLNNMLIINVYNIDKWIDR